MYEPSAHYLSYAAARARGTYANTEAIAFYRAAIDAVEQVQRAGGAEHWHTRKAELAEQLAEVLGITGAHDEARGVYRETAALLPERQRVARARMLRKGASLWVAQRQVEPALELYQEAEDLLGSEPPADTTDWHREWLEIQLSRGHALYYGMRTGPLDELIAAIAPAVARYAAPAQWASYGNLRVLADFRRMRYRIDAETRAAAREIVDAISPYATLSERTYPLALLGICHLLRDELEEAEQPLSESLQLAERTGHLEHQMFSLTYLTTTQRRLGRPDAVRHLAERSLRLSTELRSPMYIGAALGNQCWLAWRTGARVEAARLGQQALETWQAFAIPFPFQWIGLWPLMALAAEDDDLARCREVAALLFAPPKQRMPAPLEDALQVVAAANLNQEPADFASVVSQTLKLAEELKFL